MTKISIAALVLLVPTGAFAQYPDPEVKSMQDMLKPAPSAVASRPPRARRKASMQDRDRRDQRSLRAGLVHRVQGWQPRGAVQQGHRQQADGVLQRDGGGRRHHQDRRRHAPQRRPLGCPGRERGDRSLPHQQGRDGVPSSDVRRARDRRQHLRRRCKVNAMTRTTIATILAVALLASPATAGLYYNPYAGAYRAVPPPAPCCSCGPGTVICGARRRPPTARRRGLWKCHRRRPWPIIRPRPSTSIRARRSSGGSWAASSATPSPARGTGIRGGGGDHGPTRKLQQPSDSAGRRHRGDRAAGGHRPAEGHEPSSFTIASTAAITSIAGAERATAAGDHIGAMANRVRAAAGPRSAQQRRGRPRARLQVGRGL
jgi:hypothetical protein